MRPHYPQPHVEDQRSVKELATTPPTTVEQFARIQLRRTTVRRRLEALQEERALRSFDLS